MGNTKVTLLLGGGCQVSYFNWLFSTCGMGISPFFALPPSGQSFAMNLLFIPQKNYQIKLKI
jgi:hypothetical protein